jgi:hypothetical protein
MGLQIELTTHTARYFFANVVADGNGIELQDNCWDKNHRKRLPSMSVRISACWPKICSR